jgi:hypothetical protein
VSFSLVESIIATAGVWCKARREVMRDRGRLEAYNRVVAATPPPPRERRNKLAITSSLLVVFSLLLGSYLWVRLCYAFAFVCGLIA